MEDAERDRVKVGEHEFEFIAPDQLRFVIRGEFSDGDVDPYFDFIHSHANRCGTLIYGAYDLSGFTRVTSGARQRVVKVTRPYPYAALVVIGAGFSTRTLATMILTAGKLVAPNQFTFPIKFVSSVNEANAWFDELRSKRI